MITALTSGWLAALVMLAAAAAAAALFRMKVRPPRVAVASLWLWTTVLDRPRERTWWDRVRWFVSLAVTVAIAIALASALWEPLSGAGGERQGRVLLVLDSAISMQARTRDGRTRWAHAVSQARQIAARSESVLLATTGDGLVEGPTLDIALVDAALASLAPHGGDAGGWPHPPDVTETHFFTDGAVPRRLDNDVVVHSVHEAAPNVAITAFGARASPSVSSGAEAYVQLNNYSTAARRVRLTVTRGASVLVERDTELAAGEGWRQVVPLELRGDPRLHAHVSTSGDALSADDDAVAWLEEARPLKVDVVGVHASRLAALLHGRAGLEVRAVPAADYQPSSDADVVVFDRWVPGRAPERPALCIAPPAVAWLGAQRVGESVPLWGPTAAHPVLSGVDLLTLDVEKIAGHAPDRGVVIAASRRGTPLVSVRDEADSRLVVVGFEASEARVTASPAFPVLLGNALEWLARPALVEPGLPGTRDLPASTTSVTTPAGDRLPLVRIGAAVRARFDDPGLYLVQLGSARSVIAVNVAAPELSNLAVTSVPVDVSSPRGTRGASAWWPYVLWIVAAFASIEWITWHRRITV